MTLGDTGSCSRAGRQAADRAAGDRAAGRRGGPEIRGRPASRGLGKNDIRALAPARAPAARPQIEPPGTAPPDAAAEVCLAHLIREAKYAIEAGDSAFAPGL